MKNQSKILVVIILFFIFSSAFSKSFLWEVSTNQSKLYLLGSIHVGNESMYPLKPNLAKTFSDSDAVVVEVDMTNPENLGKLQSLIVKNGLIKEGEALKDIISPDLFGKVQAEFEKLGLPSSNFTNQKPWLIAVSLLNMKVMQLGFKSEYGIDLYFLNEAKKSGKPIKELETVEYQIKTLAELSNKTQNALLDSALDRSGNYSKTLNRTIKYWISGNTKDFYNMYFNEIYSKTKYKELVNRLFYDRNKEMAEKITGYLQNKEKNFIIIGAGHLIGSNGVLDLLKKKGYKIKQL